MHGDFLDFVKKSSQGDELPIHIQQICMYIFISVYISISIYLYIDISIYLYLYIYVYMYGSFGIIDVLYIYWRILHKTGCTNCVPQLILLGRGDGHALHAQWKVTVVGLKSYHDSTSVWLEAINNSKMSLLMGSCSYSRWNYWNNLFMWDDHHLL